MAEGVLIICIGKYTKLVDYITSKDKEYIAGVKLGVLTDTLDITGNTLEEQEVEITKDKLEKTINSFIKTYNQEVPIYSAVKINGKKLYEYARENIKVDLPSRDVTIYNIDLLNFNNDEFTFKTTVSKGTYIRSLILDIAKSLNTIGVMSSLIRTKQGKINIEDSYTLENIEKGKYKLLKAKDVLDYKIIELTDFEYFKVKNGVKLEKSIDNGLYILTYQNEEIAIYEFYQEIGKMKVFLGD